MTATVEHRMWANKQGFTAPEWVQAAMAETRQPNGTFLLDTPTGQARVHVGHVVIERKDQHYTCAPVDMPALLAELDENDIVYAPLGPKQPGAGRPKAAPQATVPMASTGRHRAATSPAPAFAPQLGNPPSIEQRPVADLRIDDSYQRSIDTGASQRLIRSIAAVWDWRMCMPLVVSRRHDGSFYVIDGQHRLEGARLRGDVQFLPCCISTYASVAEEAAMFVAMNRTRRAINRLDDLHAATAGGDPEAMAITKMVTDAGFTVSRKTGHASWTPGEVAFTSAIATIYRKHGPSVVAEALEIMASSFGGQRLTAGSPIFTALAKILAMPPARLDKARLFTAVSSFDMAAWSEFIATCAGGDDRHRRIRAMLLESQDLATQAVAA
ncbi:DUF6551 family protein [Sphingomonas arantia]|uniref:DUF6551 family protein n=1 Tax=Sphingomonas arantia TaxID=1460676 RepID=A0ABW4TZ65_9SPHN